MDSDSQDSNSNHNNQPVNLTLSPVDSSQINDNPQGMDEENEIPLDNFNSHFIPRDDPYFEKKTKEHLKKISDKIWKEIQNHENSTYWQVQLALSKGKNRGNSYIHSNNVELLTPQSQPKPQNNESMYLALPNSEKEILTQQTSQIQHLDGKEEKRTMIIQESPAMPITANLNKTAIMKLTDDDMSKLGEENLRAMLSAAVAHLYTVNFDLKSAREKEKKQHILHMKKIETFTSEVGSLKAKIKLDEGDKIMRASNERTLRKEIEILRKKFRECRAELSQLKVEHSSLLVLRDSFLDVNHCASGTSHAKVNPTHIKSTHKQIINQLPNIQAPPSGYGEMNKNSNMHYRQEYNQTNRIQNLSPDFGNQSNKRYFESETRNMVRTDQHIMFKSHYEPRQQFFKSPLDQQYAQENTSPYPNERSRLEQGTHHSNTYFNYNDEHEGYSPAQGGQLNDLSSLEAIDYNPNLNHINPMSDGQGIGLGGEISNDTSPMLNATKDQRFNLESLDESYKHLQPRVNNNDLAPQSYNSRQRVDQLQNNPPYTQRVPTYSKYHHNPINPTTNNMLNQQQWTIMEARHKVPDQQTIHMVHRGAMINKRNLQSSQGENIHPQNVIFRRPISLNASISNSEQHVPIIINKYSQQTNNSNTVRNNSDSQQIHSSDYWWNRSENRQLRPLDNIEIAPQQPLENESYSSGNNSSNTQKKLSNYEPIEEEIHNNESGNTKKKKAQYSTTNHHLLSDYRPLLPKLNTKRPKVEPRLVSPKISIPPPLRSRRSSRQNVLKSKDIIDNPTPQLLAPDDKNLDDNNK